MTSWKPPPKIQELFAKTDGNKFSGMNRSTAGSRANIPADVGSAPFQLYSLATPNGQKIGIALEELGVDYDAWVVNIGTGQQFNKGFVDINPNSKIPCGVDHKPSDGGAPINLFESGAMVEYLADKHGKFLPKDPRSRAECMNWVYWQMAGQGPMTGNFGHFMVYAPDGKVETRDYGVARYGMEVQRLCDVLDQALAGKKYLCGDEYTIADMMCLPWFQIIRTTGYHHPSGIGAKEILSVEQ
jgi:GST-like protein